MAEKVLPNKVFDLLIINTLHRLGDEFNIHGLVSGTVVSIYGIFIGLIAWFLFVPTSLIHSALITQLAVFSYLAILNHHILELVKTRGKELPDLGLRALSTIILVLVYLFLIDLAIGAGKFLVTLQAAYGVPNTLLWSLPGIVVLLLPLLFWEPLCKVTPVDELVERAFK